MRKKLLVKQHDFSDCGAACLASVAAWHGLLMPLSRIRQYAGTDKKGTNMAGMLYASEKLGFTSKAVRIKKESVQELPLPFIAHLNIKEGWFHFVVVYQIGKKNLKVMDPATGKMVKWSKEYFSEMWTGILLLLVPSDNFKRGKEGDSIWNRFFALLKPHYSIIIQAGFGALFYSILGLSTSVYVEKLIDYALPSGNIKLLNLMSLGFLLFLIFRLLIGFMKSYFMLHTGRKIDAVLIMGYYRHLMKLPQRFFDTMRIGEIISRVNDAAKIRNFINNVAVDMLVNLLIIIFTFTLMIIYSGRMAARMSGLVLVFIFIYIIYNKLNKKYLRTTMEQAAEVESHLVESISTITTIKRFNNGWKENSRFESRFIPLLNSAFAVNRVSLYSGSSNEAFSGIFMLLLLWSGSFMVFRQELTTGELISFYALFGYMLSPLNSIIQSNRHVQDALIAADRLFQILDLEHDSENENMVDISADDLSGIYFENVCFRYGTGKNLFKSLDIQFEIRKINGISGESGCGKSTILLLLQGIYPISAGRIMLGIYEMSYISRNSLSRLIACVPQKTDVFNGTIAENIALCDQQPDISKVIRVCHETGIMEMVEGLPLGLMTMLGENGVRLSGGELQKIALARAVYTDPEIFLFDEPTAAMDKTSEEQFKNTVNALKNKGKTLIIVSHRESTLEICDKVQHIKDGVVSALVQRCENAVSFC